uniref:Uncharacterized protein n=1 Tax=Cacopsylla melanoneura TaxID=428564 RepID=A0A8D9F6P4_9HEMI
MLSLPTSIVSIPSFSRVVLFIIPSPVSLLVVSLVRAGQFILGRYQNEAGHLSVILTMPTVRVPVIPSASLLSLLSFCNSRLVFQSLLFESPDVFGHLLI